MRRFFTSLFIAIMIITGCVRLARYDNETYKFLTFTKVDVVDLYGDKGINSELVWEIRAKNILARFDRMLEYEKHKKKNLDTLKQIELLKEILEGHVNDVEWEDWERELYMETIVLAFDGVIDSEKLKNKERF